MRTGRILATWNIGPMYWIKIIFTLVFYIFGVLLIVISLNFMPGLIVGIILMVAGVIYGSFPTERGTPGKDTISAKLCENCYSGYIAPFGPPRILIDLNEKPKLLILRYAYYFSPGVFMPLDLPWQGWNLLFIYNGNVAWGPNVSTVNYVRRDHVFMGSVVRRFRELGLEVEYAVLDPQYMDIFISELKRYASLNIPLGEMLERINIERDGTIRGRRPEKIYEPPGDLRRAEIDRTYEELLPEILSKY
ncbi:MAG: hypothetical protein ACP5GE_02690 [Thermoplasmata archaeon]|jgi:hypothetical protein